MKAAICDDNPETLRECSVAVQGWTKTEKMMLFLELFTSAELHLFRYEERRDVDFLLLDIEMLGFNGVELAKRIRWKNDQVQIIFITGFLDFIAKRYEVSAFTI